MNKGNPADPEYLLRESLEDLRYESSSVDGTLWIEDLTFTIPLRSRASDPEQRAWQDLRLGAVEALEQIRKIKPPEEVLQRLHVKDWQQWMMLVLEPLARHYEVSTFVLLHAWSVIYGPKMVQESHVVIHSPDCPHHGTKGGGNVGHA